MLWPKTLTCVINKISFFVGFSVVSDSQGGDFVSGVMPFSEDSNSQGSDGPIKRLKTVD